MKYLILLSLLLMNLNSINFSFPSKSMQGINLKLSLTTEKSAWQSGGKMPVNVAIKNDSGLDVWVKVESIRFHLSPDGANYVRTFIVPKNNTPKEIALKKAETVIQKYELSDLTTWDFVSDSSVAETFQNLPAGKYKLTVLFQTRHSVMHHGKPMDLFSNLESKMEVNIVDSAEKILLNTTLFAIGQLNKGWVSREEVALREILNRQNPANILINLINSSSPEGKLYGLLGLKLLKNNDFEAELEKVKKTINLEKRLNTPENIPLGKVRMQEGCEGFFEDSSVVIEKIVRGDYDNILETKVDAAGKIVY